MSLTPEDIEKKRFHDAWRGYNHEEVDLFLDEVAATFVALRSQGGGGEDTSERVRELEGQVDTLRRQLAQAPHGGGAGTERVRELEGQVDTLRRTLAESERNLEQTRRALDGATLQLQAAQAVSAAAGTASEVREARADELRGTENLLRRTLIAAQKAADEAVAEAEQQAAGSLAEARRAAAKIEADASAKGNAMLAAAQAQIDELEVRIQQLRALYAEHHQRARVFVEEQRQAIERMPAPEEVGTFPRHSIPEAGDPGPEAQAEGYQEGSHSAEGADGEGGAELDYEIVPLVRGDEGSDDSTRLHEAVEPRWPVSGKDAADPQWDSAEGDPSASTGTSSGLAERFADEPDDAGPSIRELFWGKG
ncbi:MAG TPA: DivIVA domain-containing protein [Actinomycetota bacterium]|nr:DivIVA domain-containing protein [Actinomycetota bacterium]